MPRDDAMLELETRRRIFRYIESNPGLHLRALQRSLDMPLGTLEYHLHQLQRARLLSIRDDGRYKAYFAEGGRLDRRDKDILYYVRQEVPRQIVMNLLLEPGLSHRELTERLPIGASTVSFHLKKLVAAETIHEERVGRGKHFQVVDAQRAGRVLVVYRRSFLDDLVDRFAGAWLDIGSGQVPTFAGPEGLSALPAPDEAAIGRLDAAAEELAKASSKRGVGDEADDQETEKTIIETLVAWWQGLARRATKGIVTGAGTMMWHADPGGQERTALCG